MSNDNLILFPKKSNPNISMSESEAKWMVSGSLMVILCLALGINSSLFSQPQSHLGVSQQADSRPVGRAPASINPIMKVSWEKRTFEILSGAKARDLANVGKAPTAVDHFAFGTLDGFYSVRKVDGLVRDIQFNYGESHAPKTLPQPKSFLMKNLALFSKEAKAVESIQAVGNGERVIKRFKMLDQEGQDLGTVQVLMDKDSNLLSMTVQ